PRIQSRHEIGPEERREHARDRRAAMPGLTASPLVCKLLRETVKSRRQRFLLTWRSPPLRPEDARPPRRGPTPGWLLPTAGLRPVPPSRASRPRLPSAQRASATPEYACSARYLAV